MCMEDIEIGRESLSAQWDYTTPAGSLQVVAADDRRIAILFAPPNGGAISFGITKAIVSGFGFQLVLGGAPVQMTIQEYGDLVKRAWYVAGSAAGLTGSVFTVSLLR